MAGCLNMLCCAAKVLVKSLRCYTSITVQIYCCTDILLYRCILLYRYITVQVYYWISLLSKTLRGRDFLCAGRYDGEALCVQVITYISSKNDLDR